MSTPYDGPPQGNPFAAVSLGAGILSMVGNGCCCIPIVNYLAIFAYPLTFLLMVAALVTGVLGVLRARQNGEGMPLAIVGLVTAGVGIVLFSMELALGGLAMVLVLLGEM